MPEPMTLHPPLRPGLPARVAPMLPEAGANAPPEEES